MKEFMQRIVREAGEKTRSFFGNAVLEYTKQDASDPVTQADLASNDILVAQVKKTYPTHGIISEEMPAYQADAEYVWIFDPLDGTQNFLKGIPDFAVMAALKRKGECIFSCIFEPIKNNFFFAEKGGGAFLNDIPTHCSSESNIPYTLGVMSSGICEENLRMCMGLYSVSSEKHIKVTSYQSTGVAAALVAGGRRDWCMDKIVCVWDYLPAILLLSEAGCVVTDYFGNPWTEQSGGFLAANPTLHKKLVRIFNNVGEL